MRSLLLLAAFGLALSAWAGGQPSPLDSVLKHVPNDAALVLVIPDMDKLASGLAAFGEATDVDELAAIDKQQLIEGLHNSDLIGEALEHLGSIKAFALALGPDYREPVAIFWVADPAGLAAVKAKIEASDAAEQESRDEFAKAVNHVIISGADKEIVEAAASASGKVATRMRKELGSLGEDKSLLLWIDVPVWRPRINEGLAMAESFLEMMMAMGGQQAEAGMGLWKWLLDSSRMFVSETEVYAAAVRVSAEGFFGADLAKFKPDGEIAGCLKKARKSQADLLRGLPDERAAVVFGCEWLLPEGTETLSEQMLKAMFAGLTTETQPADEERAARIKRALGAYGQLSGYNGAVTFARGGKAISAAGLSMTRNPKLLMQNVRSLTEVGAEIMEAFAPGLSVEVTQRQETIGSVQADVYTSVFDAEDERVGNMLTAMYGGPITVYVAPHPDGVLYAKGAADAARQQFSKLLVGGGGKMSENEDVATALKSISTNPQMCLLVDLIPVFGWGMHMAETAGAPVPEIDLPEKTPYVAFGLYFERDTLRAELWVPAPAVKALVEAIEAVEEAGESGPM